MDAAILERRGRWLLWGLIAFIAGQGVLSRYGLPEEAYFWINSVLGGDYALQERALAGRPLTDGAHRLLGIAMLVLGMLQFDAGLRRRRPRLHRWTGRAFLGCALVIGTTGLVLGFTVPFAGDSERVFIGVVGCAFFALAVRAWLHARRRDFARHREWMVRLLALSLFVAVQRVYYVVLRPLLDVADPDLFIATGWSAVATTLIAAEWWIRRSRRQPAAAAALLERSPA